MNKESFEAWVKRKRIICPCSLDYINYCIEIKCHKPIGEMSFNELSKFIEKAFGKIFKKISG